MFIQLDVKSATFLSLWRLDTLTLSRLSFHSISKEEIWFEFLEFLEIWNYLFKKPRANGKREGLTLTGSLRGSSSLTVCPGRTSAPGWTWAAPPWTDPCQVAPASAESRSEIYSPPKPSLFAQPRQPGEEDRHEGREVMYFPNMKPEIILQTCHMTTDFHKHSHSCTSVHMMKRFIVFCLGNWSAAFN